MLNDAKVSSGSSGLLIAPAEIRCLIYSYVVPGHVHLYLHEQNVRMLECIQEAQDGDPDTFGRRYWNEPSNAEYTDDVWARRLRSMWGPHWRCEERAIVLGKVKHSKETNQPAVLLVCRKMYMDIIDILPYTTTFHSSGPNTLQLFVKSHTLSIGADHLHISNFAGAYSKIKDLQITMKLPRLLCEVWEEASGGDIDASLHGNWTSWIDLATISATLPTLKKLHVWLDHLDKSSWSVISERCVLAPLEKLAKNSDIDISVSLPKLHPKHEVCHRHFTDDGPSPAFQISRRYRQRVHSVVGNNGSVSVQVHLDFPVTYEIWAFVQEAYADWSDRDWEDVEEQERRQWQLGRDPGLDMREELNSLS